MDRRSLVELKIGLEFGVAADRDTLPLALTNDEGQPRVLVSRFDGAFASFYRADVPAETRSRLAALGPAVLFRDEERVKAILAADAPCDTVYRIRWYTIERVPDPTEYPSVVIADGRHAIVVDGQVVAWASTDRENERAAEVSIETLSEFRRRGYARQVTASWAASMLAAGKVVYYSHLLDNAPSGQVAASLGLTHLSDEVEYM